MTESIYTHLIYKHTSPSGKSYIGQTKDYAARCGQHQLESSRCAAFKAAIKKYGWNNFTHEILVDQITLEEANTLEVFYIAEHRSLSPNGYNLTTGGKVCKMSKETVAKLSARIYSDESKAKMSAAGKGKVISGTTKQKMSTKKQGIPRDEATKQKISHSNMGHQVTELTRQTLSASLSKHYNIVQSNGVILFDWTIDDFCLMFGYVKRTVDSMKRRNNNLYKGFHFQLTLNPN
jgi:group I intron endonuclease